MNKVDLKKSKIRIHPSMILVIIITIALGYIEQFFILLFVTTIHELSHVLIGLCYRLQVAKITFMPIGEAAVLKDIEGLKPYQKYLIIAAGPLSNILLGTIIYVFFIPKYPNLYFFMAANYSIGLFNCLPIYPLDGGRILHQVLGNSFGVLISNETMKIVSKIFCGVLCVLGIVQVILYPFNMSILAIGLYLYSINEKEYIHLTYEFYKNISMKQEKIKNHQLMPVKTIVVTSQTSIKKLIRYLRWDYYHIIYILEEGKDGKQYITETQLVKYIMKYGRIGTVQTFYEKNGHTL